MTAAAARAAPRVAHGNGGPYGNPAPTQFRKNAFDVGEYGMGVRQLPALGCDCLGLIRYFDAWLTLRQPGGDHYSIENAMCIHEEDFGILWKHPTAPVRDRSPAPPARGVVDLDRRQLRVRRVLVFFIRTAHIHFEMKATGILNTAGLRPGETPNYGTIVSPGVYAHYHQHIFNMRLDMAVDGDRNRVVEVDTVALPVGPDNPHGNAFTIRETSLSNEQKRSAPSISTLRASGRSKAPKRATGSGGPLPTSCCRSVRCRPSPTRNRWWPDARPS